MDFKFVLSILVSFCVSPARQQNSCERETLLHEIIKQHGGTFRLVDAADDSMYSQLPFIFGQLQIENRIPVGLNLALSDYDIEETEPQKHGNWTRIALNVKEDQSSNSGGDQGEPTVETATWNKAYTLLTTSDPRGGFDLILRNFGRDEMIKLVSSLDALPDDITVTLEVLIRPNRNQLGSHDEVKPSAILFKDPQIEIPYEDYIKQVTEEHSIVLDIFLPPLTENQKDTSNEILTTLSSDAKLACDTLKAVIEQVGGQFAMTNNVEESSLSKLNILFQTIDSYKMSSDLFSVTLGENYDEIFKSTPPLESRYIFDFKQKIARMTGREAHEVIVHSVRSLGTFTVTFSFPDNGLDQKSEDILQILEEGLKLTVLLSKNAQDLIPVLKLHKSDFDSRGDATFYGYDLTRGGLPYTQPSSKWRRVGLSVVGRYDNGNDDWLAMDGREGEWTVGFHGSSTFGTKVIAKTRIYIVGRRQAFQYSEDINPLGENMGKQCGRGIYFAQSIEIANDYACDTEVAGVESRLVFQNRLHPKYLRIPKGKPGYRIVPKTEYVRPYGICIKAA